jgi:hypothetical protein
LSLQFYSTIAKASDKPPNKRKPRKRTKVTETQRRSEALQKFMSNAMRLDLVSGFRTFKKRVSAEALMGAWKSGDYSKLFAHIPWDKLPGDLGKANAAVARTAQKAGEMQLEILPPNINKKLRFDVENPVLRTYLQKRTAELVTRVNADTKTVIRDAVTRSFTTAVTPRQVADQIKGSIGLLPSHALAVEKYREGLVEAKVAPAQVEKLADAYADKLLDYRAMNIARTETRGAINQGQLSVWREGVNQGYIDRETAEKEWLVDGAPCPICEPMDGTRVGIDDAFEVTYPDGTVEYVQTPSEIHPSCQCSMALHFGETEIER